LSSAILYVAIVAIWAGVLIPRWLRRDSSASEPVADDADGDQPVAPSSGSSGEDTAGARDGAARRAREEDVGRGRAGESRAFESRVAPRDEEHARMLSARRRLLGLLLALTIASGALEVTRVAAWWVVVPPTVMLLGYLGLLRAAAKVDAERRELARTHAATSTERPAAPTAPAPVPVPVPVPGAAPVPAPDAEIIEISASAVVAEQADEECYDQYADAKLRAVGDLAGAHAQDLRPAAMLMRGQRGSFARLTQVLGAVAQSGSAPRSHRGGQGFKSPQLHPSFPRSQA
jgi:hypothetical protein